MGGDMLYRGAEKDLTEPVLPMIAEDKKVGAQLSSLLDDGHTGLTSTHQPGAHLQPTSIPRDLCRSLQRAFGRLVQKLGSGVQRQSRPDLNHT